MKTAFLQFANLMKFNGLNYIGLGNGFSDTWDFCKDHGEFKWFFQRYTTKSEQQKIEEAKIWCSNANPPITTENLVYCSAINIINLYQIYVWSRKFRDVTFVVGGPAVCSKLFSLKKPLPENMILTTKTVEEFFNISNFSYKWKLEVPDFKSDGIAFAYTIDTKCYWGKCIFCGAHSFCKERKREKLEFEFRDINYNGNILIRLNSPAITAGQISNFNKLPKRNNITYSLLMRGATAETKQLIDFTKNSDYDFKFSVGIGIEFPSNKMYSYMNKGITVEEITKNIIELSKFKNINVMLTAILGWNNLDNNDLKNLEKFCEDIKNSRIGKLILYRLHHVHSREIHTRKEVEKELGIGPFYLGYIPKLDQEQKRLNDMAYGIFEQSDQRIINYYA
jgi:hypothetical protein